MVNSTPSHKLSSYRPDVDGLRAIAVLSVILFHINESLLPGGFVGVDIFFVISGYLISLHILQDIDRGQFSIIEFYRRRVKRIAPPMLTVVLVTMVVAQLIMLPEDAERVADSALWSLFSLANVYFWLHQDTSYFAAATSQLPLLHLWSLGVEEQFYVFWPVLLALAYCPSRSKHFFVVATLATVASFGFAEAWFSHDPSFVYYMFPTRVGELLIGAIVALAALRGIETRLPAAAIGPIAFGGLLLVIGSLFFLTEKDVFPGVLAVPPTLGTGMLILAGHCAHNRVSSFLSLKLLVGVGLVSYSAYLWHWPLLAFIGYGQHEVGIVQGLAVFLLTFLLAWLSYAFIEKPARASQAKAIWIFGTQYVIPAGAIAVLALAAMYIDGYGFRWYSGDYRSQLVAYRDQTRPAHKFDYVCQRQRISLADTKSENCILGLDSTQAPRVILWGDSNAAHYVGVVGAFALHADFQFRNLAVGHCPPLIEDLAPFVSANRLSDCQKSAGPVSTALQAAEIVIVSARYQGYVDSYDDFLNAFFTTVENLNKAGKLVILMGQVPFITGYDRRCREKALSYPWLECPRNKRVPPTIEITNVNRELMEYAARNPNVEYFDVNSYLCPDKLCSAFDSNGAPLYFDPGHLSLPGSWKIGHKVLEENGLPAPFARIVVWLKEHKRTTESVAESRSR